MLSNEFSLSLLAVVELSSPLSLRQTADLLGLTFGDFFEETDRFDEVPAFWTKQGRVQFTLFGIPDGEVCDCYILEMEAETEQGLEEIRREAPLFICDFLREKLQNDRGYVDFSSEFVTALQAAGITAHIAK